MNRNKKAVISISILAFIAVMIAGIVYAWIVNYRRSMIVIVGDANITVDGWYALIGSTQELENLELDKWNEFVDYTDERNNPFYDLPQNEFIAYKFQVTNKSTRDAKLSIRLSNLFDYIFDCYGDYLIYDYMNATRKAEFDNRFREIAERNNGKLTYKFDSFSFEYGQMEYNELLGRNEVVFGEKTTISIEEEKDAYIWKYCQGERFVGTEGDDIRTNIDAIFLPGVDANNVETKVNIYMVLTSDQKTHAMEAYRKWLLGDEETVGAGQAYAAEAQYNKTWRKLVLDSPSYANIIDEYLRKFVDSEIAAIISNDDEGSRFNLDIKYFEFIGENIPHVIS